MTAVPELETERLRLRAFRIEDVEPMAAINADLAFRFGGRPGRRDRTANTSMP